MANLLVVGAQPGSIGHAVAEEARDCSWNVRTAGITKHEDHELDVMELNMVDAIVRAADWHAVVCTVGVNFDEPPLPSPGWIDVAIDTMGVNYFGPMNVMAAWLRYWGYPQTDAPDEVPTHRFEHVDTTLQFVAISSNSAVVPRSSSPVYCGSKAALSQSLRSVARAYAEYPFSIYAWEPGWVEGTPMSEGVLGRLPAGVNRSRTPGQRHLDPAALAALIVAGLDNGRALNGTTLRPDGGER